MGTTPPPTPEVDLQEAIREVKKRLGEFIVAGPLYTAHDVPKLNEFYSLPETIQLACSTCSKVQTFQRSPTGRLNDKGWGLDVEYRCRNCGTREQKYWYVWKDYAFWKVGQIPELPEKVDRQLAKALGTSKAFYLKAVRARDFGFGIGALAYLRRIVEDTTDMPMGFLKEDKWERWSPSERQEFEAVITTYQYARKMEYAATAILPRDLFVGGADSFSRLHDVTSAGIHGKSEEDCIELF